MRHVVSIIKPRDYTYVHEHLGWGGGVPQGVVSYPLINAEAGWCKTVEDVAQIFVEEGLPL